MARNPFTDDSFPQGKLNRNSFDLSRRSVFTTDFFKLYPYLCQEVLPGDSFEIDARIGIRGMPTVFPVQTRVRMSTEFYYVRNRTLMKNKEWEDFVFKNKDIELPWIKLNTDRAKQMISTGSLGDALGVPTTRAVGSEVSYRVINSDSIYIGFKTNITAFNSYTAETYRALLSSYLNLYGPYRLIERSSQLTDTTSLAYGVLVDISNFPSVPEKLYSVSDGHGTSLLNCVYYAYFIDGILQGFSDSNILPSDSDGHFYVDISSIQSELQSALDSKKSVHILFLSCILFQNSYSLAAVSTSNSSSVFAVPSLPQTSVLFPLEFSYLSDKILDSTDDLVISENPFVGDNPAIRLSALKFRAYEQVTNYYYVNEKNNPLVFNGQVEYNEFLPSYDAGPDSNVYDFHYRNWELDQYTSALQTPQMGDAPLVGVIFTGDKTAELTFQGSLDGESPSDIKVTVGLDDDDNVEQILDFPSEMPSADLQRLQQRIQAGFSINQFRVTNSFQRFLENSLFRGRRYRNQMKSHHRVSVDFPDIDIPQYIGGASSIMDVGQVTNMADSPNAGLGDYIGTLQGGVSTRNKIRCYCPEHGFILAIVSFCPIPSYAQAIDKSLLKRDAFDYFNPEFGKIGFVPVRYSELSPLQTPVGGTVHDVFGYQKAWYEYMAALDEVHGDFRTTLAPFVLTRTFAERPQLSSSFTVGSPEQLNDIFVTQNIVDAYNSSAKFLASAEINIKALRQIPIVGTPSLE